MHPSRIQLLPVLVVFVVRFLFFFVLVQILIIVFIFVIVVGVRRRLDFERIGPYNGNFRTALLASKLVALVQFVFFHVHDGVTHRAVDHVVPPRADGAALQTNTLYPRLRGFPHSNGGV